MVEVAELFGFEAVGVGVPRLRTTLICREIVGKRHPPFAALSNFEGLWVLGA